jgi:K+-H+ exchange-related protein
MTDSLTVFLVPAGHDRFELYSEAPDESPTAPAQNDRVFRQWAHRVSVRWHALVEAARHGSPTGRLARWRDRVVSRLAETIAEQRTLWALRDRKSVILRSPSSLETARVRAILDALLAHARSHHLRWLIIDLILFIVSGILFFVPGPNLVAYYIAFRLVGHVQSWRGARQAMEVIAWTLEPDPGLAELASLVDVPRETRAPRVAAIAERLNLPRLTAFFDRVAVPSS